MNCEPVLYDPETDMLLVELRPWPATSPAEVNEQVGGEDVEEGLVVHYGSDGRPHAFEIEHASERPDLVARALSALRHAKGFAARASPGNTKLDDMARPHSRPLNDYAIERYDRLRVERSEERAMSARAWILICLRRPGFRRP